MEDDSKEHFTLVDGPEFIAYVLSLPVQWWAASVTTD